MARKGENIYHRKDGRWEGRYLKARENGKPRYGYVFDASYSAARKKLQEARSNWKTACEIREREKTTLAAVSLRWLEDAKPFSKESRIAKYRDFLQCYILPRFGNVQAASLSTESLQDFLSAMLVSGGEDGKGLAPRTVAGILCILKSIRKYAMNQGYAVGFSTESLSLKQKQKQPRIFSEQETMRLRSYLRGHLTERNAGILLCLETGLRLGEICALRWSDVSFDERKLFVRQTAQRIRMDDENTEARQGLWSRHRKAILPRVSSLCRTAIAGSFCLSEKTKDFCSPETITLWNRGLCSGISSTFSRTPGLRMPIFTPCAILLPREE